MTKGIQANKGSQQIVGIHTPDLHYVSSHQDWAMGTKTFRLKRLSG